MQRPEFCCKPYGSGPASLSSKSSLAWAEVLFQLRQKLAIPWACPEPVSRLLDLGQVGALVIPSELPGGGQEGSAGLTGATRACWWLELCMQQMSVKHIRFSSASSSETRFCQKIPDQGQPYCSHGSAEVSNVCNLYQGVDASGK